MICYCCGIFNCFCGLFKCIGRAMKNCFSFLFCCWCCPQKPNDVIIKPKGKDDDANKSTSTSEGTREVMKILDPLIHGKEQPGEVDDLDFNANFSDKETQTDESSFSIKI